MNEKLMRLPKPVVVFIGAVIAAGFLGVMDLSTLGIRLLPQLPGYGATMLSELSGGLYAVIILAILGYLPILAKRGQGFAKGLYIGGFMTGYCLLEIVAQLYMQAMNSVTNIQPILNILYFTLTMFLIGWGEELIFRGILLNLFLDRFSKTKRGILLSVVISGCLFGAVHLTNIFSGVSVLSALIQALEAAFLGIIFGAIYVRSGNIWIVILFHAVVDFAALMGGGIFGNGTVVDQINQLSGINLIAVPIFVVPCLVLLRRKKLEELEQRANNIVVFETYEEADSNALTSLVLGILSIVTGFVGYGIGLGIVGLLGAVFSKKIKPQQNGVATAGMVTSIIGIVISIIGVIVMLLIYSSMDMLLSNLTFMQ